MDTEEYRDHPVRSYVLTSGRAHPSRNTLRPETLVRAVESRPLLSTASRMERELVQLCRGTLALAEIAAYLQRPDRLVAVMVSDLIDAGRQPIRSKQQAHVLLAEDILAQILDGLHQL